MRIRFLKRMACLLVMLCVSLSAGAVLKEKNLNSTLSVLRAELETTFNEQRKNMARYTVYAQTQHKQMISLMQRSDQVALMLYSQKQDFTFDMTYACHEATEMYREFSKRSMPYKKIMKRMDSELTRYKYLIETLSKIPPSMKRMERMDSVKQAPKFIVDKNGKQRKLPFMLDGQGLHDRKACLDYAVALSRNLQNMRNSVEMDEQHYQRMATKLKKMNDYAIQRYNDIQHTIFVNGDQSYIEILKNMPMQYHSAKADVNEKYDEEKVKSADGGERKVYSQWRGPIVAGLSVFVLLYMLLAGMLSNVLVRWLVPKRFRTEEFMKKKVCLILFVAMFIFAVSVMVARTFMYHNFFLMASKLLIEYAWLLCAIFFSLLVRLPGDQIKSGFRIYAPIMLMSFIVITFRIIFIPNNLVTLIFPPILLAFTVWQWRVVKRHNANIPRSDIFYTWISLAIMVFSTASALYGYVLLSVQVLIWWMFQLSCIQTITCVYDMLAQYEKRYLAHKIHSEAEAEKAKKGSVLSIITTSHNKHINVTWFYDFVYMALVPMVQPPVIRLCTTQAERKIKMTYKGRPVSKTTKILFPIAVTIIVGLVAPQAVALIGFLMFGNLIRECGVLNALSETAQNVLANLITVVLGLTVAGQMTADRFVQPDTLLILALGLVAFVFDTAGGVLFAKLVNLFLPEGKKLNPMIGAAGISAFPMSGRVVNKMGLEEDNQNFLLMYSISVNVSGQIASVIAGGLILTLMA